MSNLDAVRKFLRDGETDLSKITLREIRYALGDIIIKAQMRRRTKRDEANVLQREIPSIFQLKAMKLASIGEDALADEMLKVRKRLRDPERINIYDQTDWDCLLEAESSLRKQKAPKDSHQ